MFKVVYFASVLVIASFALGKMALHKSFDAEDATGLSVKCMQKIPRLLSFLNDAWHSSPSSQPFKTFCSQASLTIY